MNEHFATELLKEVKTNAKRWFIAFCVMVVLEVATIIGFMWYITLPVEEVTRTEQTVDDIEASTITQIGGDNYGQSETDKDNL
jgi:hypothetical protein